jgi:hypothetical protein
MVTLPENFVATRYPGYFWNLTDKKLYSLKITGELRPLVVHKGGKFNGKFVEPGYRIYAKGIRKSMTLKYLNDLTKTKDIQEIGIFRDTV